jgi:hypothetical protein
MEKHIGTRKENAVEKSLPAAVVLRHREECPWQEWVGISSLNKHSLKLGPVKNL